MNKAALARKNLERRLAPLREMSLTAPSRGWLRAIREALGMQALQLANRLNVVPSRITTLEKAEAHGSVTLKSLREAAEAMDCMLVYAIVPKRPMDEILRVRAEEKADRELARLNHTMGLENQALRPEDLKAARARKIAELIEGAPRRLWDES